MHPDLPEPVVPATSTCGISARSALTAWPETSLPSQQGSGERALRRLGVDVAEADKAATLVGHLDPDRLLAGDRGEDADVGRGERVGEVVLELRDLRDLGPGRELELVAAHVRTADNAQQARLDTEVAQRLEQRLRGRLAVAHVRARIGLAALERLRRRRPIGDLLRRGDPVALALGTQRGGSELAVDGIGDFIGWRLLGARRAGDRWLADEIVGLPVLVLGRDGDRLAFVVGGRRARR